MKIRMFSKDDCHVLFHEDEFYYCCPDKGLLFKNSGFHPTVIRVMSFSDMQRKYDTSQNVIWQNDPDAMYKVFNITRYVAEFVNSKDRSIDYPVKSVNPSIKYSFLTLSKDSVVSADSKLGYYNEVSYVNVNKAQKSAHIKTKGTSGKRTKFRSDTRCQVMKKMTESSMPKDVMEGIINAMHGTQDQAIREVIDSMRRNLTEGPLIKNVSPDILRRGTSTSSDLFFTEFRKDSDLSMRFNAISERSVRILPRADSHLLMEGGRFYCCWPYDGNFPCTLENVQYMSFEGMQTKFGSSPNVIWNDDLTRMYVIFDITRHVIDFVYAEDVYDQDQNPELIYFKVNLKSCVLERVYFTLLKNGVNPSSLELDSYNESVVVTTKKCVELEECGYMQEIIDILSFNKVPKGSFQFEYSPDNLKGPMALTPSIIPIRTPSIIPIRTPSRLSLLSVEGTFSKKGTCPKQSSAVTRQPAFELDLGGLNEQKLDQETSGMEVGAGVDTFQKPGFELDLGGLNPQRLDQETSEMEVGAGAAVAF